MGYDSKAIRVPKQYKVMAGNDKNWLKQMKQAIEQQAKQSQSRKRSNDSE